MNRKELSDVSARVSSDKNSDAAHTDHAEDSIDSKSGNESAENTGLNITATDETSESSSFSGIVVDSGKHDRYAYDDIESETTSQAVQLGARSSHKTDRVGKESENSAERAEEIKKTWL